MGMTDQADVDIRFSLTLHLPIQIVPCLFHALIEGFTARFGKINLRKASHQTVQKPFFVLMIRRKQIVGLKGCFCQIVEIVAGIVQNGKLGLLKLHHVLHRHSAAAQTGPETELHLLGIAFFFHIQKYFMVIAVHSLIGLSVDI